MNENDFWNNDLFPYLKPHGHFTRVENHEVGPGIPDVDFCIKKNEGHMELKYTHTMQVKMRRTQYRWFKARKKAGGNPCMLTKIIKLHETIILLHDAKAVIDLRPHINWHIAEWTEMANRVWEMPAPNFIEDLIWELKSLSK